MFYLVFVVFEVFIFKMSRMFIVFKFIKIIMWLYIRKNNKILKSIFNYRLGS